MPRKLPATQKSATTTTTRAREKKQTTKTVIDENVRENLLAQIKIDIKHKNELQKKLTNAIKTGDVTLCTGPAGTGKTLLSVAEALLLLKQRSDVYHEIKLVKSIIQLKDEDMGTLPGDEKDKLKFIMMSFFDAFHQLIGEELTSKLLAAGYIKMEVFGSMRGRSLPNCILLFDEFQNVSDGNGKTLLTRFSENTKVIALGDANQVDLKNPESSCLAELVKFAKMYPEEGVNVVEFSENDIVRHRLTKYFIKLFEHPDYKKKQTTEVKKPKQLLTEAKTTTKQKNSFFLKILNFFSMI